MFGAICYDCSRCLLLSRSATTDVVTTISSGTCSMMPFIPGETDSSQETYIIPLARTFNPEFPKRAAHQASLQLPTPLRCSSLPMPQASIARLVASPRRLAACELERPNVKIAVLLSGGVDSSVALKMVAEAGHWD